MAESHRILIETYDDVAPLKHVNIGFVDLKMIFNINDKSWNEDFHALLDEIQHKIHFRTCQRIK